MARVRVMHLMQYEKNPKTQEVLITQAMVNSLLDHQTITEWAYCWHDKDLYKQSHIDELKDRLKDEYMRTIANNKDENGVIPISIDDYIKQQMDTEYSYVKVNQPKPKHIHIMMRFKNPIDTALISSWSGVPERMIRPGKGRNAFFDLLKYLTHTSINAIREQKIQYPVESVVANFDYKAKMKELEQMMTNYGTMLDEDEQMRLDVLLNGKTLDECMETNALVFEKNMERLRKCRLQYLSRQEPPLLRLNYYIEGRGGIGKGVLSRTLAKALFPDVKHPYFEVGGENVTFEGYDGQPVIIWNDMRASTFIQKFGRGETFDILDTHPTSSRHNVKYGSIVLSNTINIINGIEYYRVFLDGLSGEYIDRMGNKLVAEDKGQAYRRIPIVICLREADCDILINKGVAEGTRDYQQYVLNKKLQGSFSQVVQNLSGMAQQTVLEQMTKPILDVHNTVVSGLTDNRISDVANIPSQYANFGQELPITNPVPIHNSNSWNELYDSPDEDIDIFAEP